MIAQAYPDRLHNRDQIGPASSVLPIMDKELLFGGSMRGVRFLVEYATAQEALRARGVRLRPSRSARRRR